ncbi:valine--tRNA ligase [Xanthomonas graminis]|uniref:Valine--tRNA ligase n=1 Tax=Xanthomonas graminis pv. graminis TaxID=134874 RepID=A0A1M4ICB8_9XANT|nr:valine--tRNA ligase [Xanthomonas translucens]EKU26503.1 valyl-tRNA synthetase [Xanthomonas translucens pv. graminis ART-Xtg29]OAX60383.1 valine--tRNA ligase [Xanthomonas translucens pv. graminis]UKE53953.1 valine--tRNA ligase [Xanthomonas translucens pv. graminis]WIH09417.1 valine--tRNA ligase [Xanthomonas translucens pv. graminis]WIH12978.1 valine--tRNA ligase [Xanthomonas translucens pv. graminis]
MTTLAPSYDPTSFESRLYAQWEAAGYFKPSGQGEAYTVLLPPPNVTGTLHMGHAFQHTLMDALVRYHRMRGYDTLWQMGSDHAGIATEMVVSRNLALAGKGETRDALGREGFIAKVWEWKAQSGDTIERQMRRLGASGDWSRSSFTMDPQPSAAVVEAFVRWHEQGLIYRGQRLVNWDPVLKTAISDLEVENVEEDGFLWSIAYALEDGASYEHVEHDADGNETLRETRDYLVVATTRPETLLGDTAVMVHPDDTRYAHLIGRTVTLPLTGRKVPVIGDDYVDRAFGTGVVKVTPAHDFNDYQVGVRHGLPMINILTDDAKIRHEGEYSHKHRGTAEDPGPRGIGNAQNAALAEHRRVPMPEEYRGLDRYEARKRILAHLEDEGRLVETKPHKLQVPRGDRTGQVIEPYLTDQWFVKMDALAKRGLELVESGQVKFVPPNWINTYRHWMENIQDWCISRQLWWGHRIPAWFDDAGTCYVGHDEADVRAKHGLGADIALHQDSDVLETWFSSQLWPFSTMGWPDPQAMAERGFDRYLPSSVLVTGFDIIFFWVARMIMASDSFTGQVPFRDVYITGLIRDKDGQKMSKSKGNVLDPLDIIDGISIEDLVAKRTTGLMKPKDAPKIEKATRKEFPEGIIAHGADALRFTIAALAGHGRDIKFDLGRAEGYKNFCNKLWNASRFVLMNTRPEDPAAATATNASPRVQRVNHADTALHQAKAQHVPVTDAEKWILVRLDKVSAEAQAHYAAYRFDLLAQCLYEFAWNEFCDWFLELTKPALNGDDAAAADSTRHTLLQVLETLLRLLHPLTPFVTEELWQQVAPRLGIAAPTISLQPYPRAGDFDVSAYAGAEADIEWLKAMVSALRRVRSELNVPPSRLVPLLLQGGHAEDRAQVQRFASQLKFLLRLEAIQWLDAAQDAPPAAAAIVGELRLLVPLEGLVDLDAERTRLDKEIKRVDAEIGKCNGKLGNATFVQNAPAAVVEQERARLADWTTQLAGLREQRAKL